MTDLPSFSGEVPLPFVLEGVITSEELTRLRTFIGELTCGDTTRLILNPERIPHTDEGFRIDMLESLPEGHFISRIGLSRYAAEIAGDKWEAGTLRQRAHVGFDAIARHLQLGHLQPKTPIEACACPLRGIERTTPVTTRSSGKTEVLIAPATIIAALEGDASQEPPLGPMLWRVPVKPRTGQLSNPGQQCLFISPSFEVIRGFAAALRAV